MKFIGFEVSKRKNKKYNAIVLNEKTGRTKKIPFGDRRYEHFKDRTGLGEFSHLDHNDKKRRELYLKRHSKDKDKPFTAGFYASKYLW